VGAGLCLGKRALLGVQLVGQVLHLSLLLRAPLVPGGDGLYRSWIEISQSRVS